MIRLSKGMDSHLAQDPAMVGSQRRVVQAPVLQIIKIPLRHWQMSGDLHPMSLSLIVTMHGRSLESYITIKS